MSETGFQQLLKKAQKSDLMPIFISWIKENQAMISLDSARTLLDLLIDDGITAFKGIGMIAETSDQKKTRGKWLLTMFEKEKEKLKVLFGQILEVVELYSQKLKLTATAVFPMDYADVDFTVILYEVLKKRPMEVEIELCESLRNILKSSHANGPAVKMLSERLFTLFKEAYSEKIFEEEDSLFATLERLVTMQTKGHNANIVGVFAYGFGGKLEHQLCEKLLEMARVLGYDHTKKDECCMELLKNWVMAEGHECLTRHCIEQIYKNTDRKEPGQSVSSVSPELNVGNRQPSTSKKSLKNAFIAGFQPPTDPNCENKLW